MIVRRQFIFEEDNQGTEGFMPLWIPRSANYGALDSARMFLHDSLEHAMTDKGTIANEITAYGRLLPFRITNFIGSRKEFAANLGKELGDMLWIIFEISGNKPRRALPFCESRLAKQTISDDGYSRLVHSIAQSCADLIIKYDTEGRAQRYFGFDFDTEIVEYVEGWLKLGFFDMCRKMGDLTSVESIGTAVFDPEFTRIMDRDIEEAKEYAISGSIMTMTLDLTVHHDPQCRMTLHRNHDAGWIRQARFLRNRHN